jgi:predicted small secreted protein
MLMVSISDAAHPRDWPIFSEGVSVPRLVSLTLISLLTLCFSALIFLAASNTTAGAGRDISKAGQAIANAAMNNSY